MVQTGPNIPKHEGGELKNSLQEVLHETKPSPAVPGGWGRACQGHWVPRAPLSGSQAPERDYKPWFLTLVVESSSHSAAGSGGNTTLTRTGNAVEPKATL